MHAIDSTKAYSSINELLISQKGTEKGVLVDPIFERPVCELRNNLKFYDPR